MLRRTSDQGISLLEIGALTLNTAIHEVEVNRRPANLTPKEFSNLEFMLYNKNRTISRFNLNEGTIIQTIRGIGFLVKDDNQ